VVKHIFVRVCVCVRLDVVYSITKLSDVLIAKKHTNRKCKFEQKT